MRRETGDFIEDITDAMRKALVFVKGMAFEEFAKDDKTVFAVVRAIEIIGEATKRIPNAIRKEYPEIPWKGMAGMRDKVIHEYFRVDMKLVWNTVKKRIPELHQLLETILDELEE